MLRLYLYSWLVYWSVGDNWDRFAIPIFLVNATMTRYCDNTTTKSDPICTSTRQAPWSSRMRLTLWTLCQDPFQEVHVLVRFWDFAGWPVTAGVDVIRSRTESRTRCAGFARSSIVWISTATADTSSTALCSTERSRTGEWKRTGTRAKSKAWQTWKAQTLDAVGIQCNEMGRQKIYTRNPTYSISISVMFLSYNTISNTQGLTKYGSICYGIESFTHTWQYKHKIFILSITPITQLIPPYHDL